MANLGRSERSEVRIMTMQERHDIDPRGLSRIAFIGNDLVSVTETDVDRPEIAEDEENKEE